jgi:ribonuclease J
MAKKQNIASATPGSKLKVMVLGGLNEVGKNITVLEYENDILIVDCGLGFPDDEMLGVDLVIPDISYLEKNRDKIRGIVLTHGHEDHIGALPYVLQEISPPVYGTRLTIGILQNKLEEHVYKEKPQLHSVVAGDKIKLGVFTVEFIHVNHSIADACCLAISTPVGVVLYSGDFKLDLTPIDGEIMDLTRIGELGKQGVLLLMLESTNAERPGYTPSERTVGQSLDNIFLRNRDKRIIIATFSSNVHRVQQIINMSHAYGRKVAITGRSMLNVVSAAVELGYMHVPEGTIIDISEIKRYPLENITIVSTGSQGEPMSALYRMAISSHDKVELGPRDLVVISAHAIPGNEKLVGRIINEIFKCGASVYRDPVVEVHVSGHACQEELKLMIALAKPKFFMPIHGEYKHLIRNKEIAQLMGIEDRRIFISDIGKILELDGESARFNGVVPAGRVLVDGYGVGDVGNIVLRDRKHLSQDGLIVVVATVDTDDLQLISGPDIVSRGFVYVRESEDLIEQIRVIARDALEDCLDNNITDWSQLKSKVKDDLSKFLYAKTHRKPMILPVVMNV